jgi:N-acetylated-alpha-linked acidic dipeptidase
VADWIKRFFGVHSRRGHGHGLHDSGPDHWAGVAFGTANISVADVQESRSRTHLPHHGPPGFSIRKFVKAAKRVRKANQKLVAFERGFISEGGIRNREWYKHLGVAPGLWLGQSSL